MDHPDSPTPAGARLPPRLADTLPASIEEALEKKAARERRDAGVRGVSSIEAMRVAIREAARDLPPLPVVPRLGRLSPDAFAREAARGLPFLIDGVVGRWPLSA
ncbi:hypothetical protein [Massilia sp. Se16.2.3]|nr:hypothetical protein [Massilia sp. Se16.2.3]